MRLDLLDRHGKLYPKVKDLLDLIVTKSTLEFSPMVGNFMRATHWSGTNIHLCSMLCELKITNTMDEDLQPIPLVYGHVADQVQEHG